LIYQEPFVTVDDVLSKAAASIETVATVHVLSAALYFLSLADATTVTTMVPTMLATIPQDMFCRPAMDW
jgi:hypothetical protein